MSSEIPIQVSIICAEIESLPVKIEKLEKFRSDLTLKIKLNEEPLLKPMSFQDCLNLNKGSSLVKIKLSPVEDVPLRWMKQGIETFRRNTLKIPNIKNFILKPSTTIQVQKILTKEEEERMIKYSNILNESQKNPLKKLSNFHSLYAKALLEQANAF